MNLEQLLNNTKLVISEALRHRLLGQTESVSEEVQSNTVPALLILLKPDWNEDPRVSEIIRTQCPQLIAIPGLNPIAKVAYSEEILATLVNAECVVSIQEDFVHHVNNPIESDSPDGEKQVDHTDSQA